MTLKKDIPYQERPDSEKIARIIKFYNTGSYTQASIARIFKITRERVRQIIQKEKGGEKE